MFRIRSLTAFLLLSVFFLSCSESVRAQSQVIEDILEILRGGNPSQTQSRPSQTQPNRGGSQRVDVAFERLVSTYQQTSLQLQFAESDYNHCRSSGASYCSDSRFSTLRGSLSSQQGLISNYMLNALTQTYEDPTRCPQTVALYSRAMSVSPRIDIAFSNGTNIRAFCRSRGYSI